jgi:hypothetical protein
MDAECQHITDLFLYRKETIEHKTRELEQEIRLMEEKLKHEKSVSLISPSANSEWYSY